MLRRGIKLIDGYVHIIVKKNFKISSPYEETLPMLSKI